jgi:hypothetical protein
MRQIFVYMLRSPYTSPVRIIMIAHKQLTLRHQQRLIEKNPTFAVVVLKESTKCYDCRQELVRGMLVRRQILRTLIRYYHLECHVMGFRYMRRRRHRRHIDTDVDVLKAPNILDCSS